MYIILLNFDRITVTLAFMPPFDKRGNRVSELFGNMSYQNDIFFLIRQYILAFQFTVPQAMLISINIEDPQSIIDTNAISNKAKELRSASTFLVVSKNIQTAVHSHIPMKTNTHARIQIS